MNMLTKVYFPSLSLPVEEPWAKNVYWMYAVVLDETTGLDSAEFGRRHREHCVFTRSFFLGIHEQSIFDNLGLFKDEHYPLAERIARKGLYLPSGLTLTEDQISHVCCTLKKLLNH